MADKITRFEDYVNKEGRQDHAGPHREGESDSFGKRADGQAEESANVEGRHDAAPQKSPEKPEQGLTQEILSIEIEDPVQFFTEEERQEYYAQMRRKETEDRIKRRTEEERAALRREQEKERSESDESAKKPGNVRRSGDGRKDEDSPARKPESMRKAVDGMKDEDSPARKPGNVRRTGDDSPAREPGQDRERRSKDDRRDSEHVPEDKRRRPDSRPYDEYQEDEYDEGFDDDEYIDDDETSGVNMDLVVRIASVITGILILAFIGIAVKVKVFDRYFTPDPDETETVVVSLPAGYTAQDDTVVVSGASSLNLRTVPSLDSDEYIATAVNEGTELKRIAVSEDGKWALVEYNGQQLYVSMKYLKVK